MCKDYKLYLLCFSPCVSCRFSYSIKEGNSGGNFEIDPVTGILIVVKPLSLGAQFQLIIVAENVNASCHRGRVKVTVVVVNKPLQFTNIEPASIPENSPNGTVVTQVEAQGGSGVVQYSIVSGNEGGVFEIDEDNGEITVANSGLLDFESNPQYQLTIQAMSTPNGVSITGILTINVTDVNEEPSFVTLCAQEGSCVFDVLENQTNNLIVDSIVAVDPDLPTTNNGMLVYSISPSGLPFSIDNNGTLRASILDREDEDMYEFMVVVMDGGNPPFTITTMVVVNVIDINDNRPEFVQGLPVFPLPEDFELGELTQYLAEDADLNPIINYSLSSSQSNLPFAIAPNDGVLSLVAPLDFDLGPRIFMFDVIATDEGGLNASFSVVVEVTDVNDNTPQFSQASYEGSIPENMPSGTPVLSVFADDLDSNLNGLVEYMILSSSMGNLFQINRTSGQITTNSVLDRESVMEVTLTVEARDMGETPRVNTTTVTITVSDVNDNAPFFLFDILLNIPEDQPIGPLETLFAFDNDQPGTPNSAMALEITAGNEEGAFSLNSSTGLLSLARQLDFETIMSYSLVVVASDMGVPMMNGSVAVEVNVININDNPPMISGNQDISVLETEPTGFAIAQFEATDLDQMSLSFSLSDDSNPDGIFAINSTGFVLLQQMIDYETTQFHELVVVVTDGTKTANATLRVIVEDVNEFPPQFVGNNNLAVSEEQPVGTQVGTVTATDADTLQTVTYSLEVSSPFFAINESSGLITTLSVLDRETLGNQLEVTVIATDNGVIPSSFFSTLAVSIEVTDINDNAPMFDRSSYEAALDENMAVSPPSSPLLTVIATDADIGENGAVEFFLIDADSLPFTIDRSTGLVSVTESLDRERNSSYNITIRAVDRGDDPLSSEVSLVITVGDVNDNAPLFPSSEITVSLREDKLTGLALFAVPRAVDADIGSNADVTYSIQGQVLCQQPPTLPLPDNCLFSIDPIFGFVQLNMKLDFETRQNHTFVVIATDGGFPTQSSQLSVIIEVINLDEVPPVFVQSCNASIPEDAPVGTFVVSCVATDFDEVSQSQTNDVTYSISSDAFSIAANGNISTSVLLDRETQDSYLVTVTARDAAGNRAVQNVSY